MERLSAMDAAFVAGETSAWHMHAGALIVLDPSDAPEGFGVESFRSLLRARTHLLGPFRRRLIEVPFGLDVPLWVTDPDIDMDAHVRAVGVPGPGGARELGRLVGELFSSKLDRTRPLWEIWFIEGLAGGRVALLAKVHHSLVDGVSGARLYEVLFDLEPDAPLHRSDEVADAVDESAPSELELVARAVWRLAGTPVRAAKTTWRLAHTLLPLLRSRYGDDAAGAPLPFQAPRTSLNQAITARRRLAYVDLPLADVKAVKAALGVTVNDVVLAVCAGGLRRYLLARDELPEAPLVAQVPVAVAPAEGDDGGAGNHVAVMGASLPTNVSDPVARVHEVATSTRSAKRLQRDLGDDVILRLAESAPPGLLAAGVRSYTRLRLSEYHPPVFNLIVSNVRGPDIPLFAAGARLEATYPMGPLLDGGGLNLTVMSSAESLHLGFLVCPDVVADPWALARHTVAAFEELRDAVPVEAVTA